MAAFAGSPLGEDPRVWAPTGRRGDVPLQLELPSESAGQRPGQQYMLGLFHDKPRDSNRMHEPFEGGDCACPKTGALHNGGVHPLDTVQLSSGAAAGIEQSGIFKNRDGAFDGEQGGPSLPENRMAGGQGLGKARRLS